MTIQPNGEKSYDIVADSTRAHLPINSSARFYATVVAKTAVKILAVDTDLTQLWTVKSRSEIDCVELIDIDLPVQLDNVPFFHCFVDDYRKNKLVLPVLPRIAFLLKEAMKHDLEVQQFVDIIQKQSVIATKLLQLANSPLYAPLTPVTNCLEAVTYLGLTATCNIVTGISMRQVFMCHDKQMMAAMNNLWRRSLYVASLSFVLAEESGVINPDDAFLAGLVNDIGAVPLLHYAELYPGEYPDLSQLETVIPYLRSPLGVLILNSFDFSEDLLCIPRHSEDWQYESGEQVGLVDIVILAKRHSYFGSRKANDLPNINTIPAYSKLKYDKFAPDFSMQVLHKANQRIKAIMSIM